MNVEREKGTDESKAAGDHGLDAMLVMVNGAKLFGIPFRPAVGRPVFYFNVVQIAFRKMCDVTWLPSVDRARAGEKKTPGASFNGKLEGSPCAFHDGIRD